MGRCWVTRRDLFLLTRNFAAEKGMIPSNPRRIIKEILNSGRSMPYDEFIDEFREDYGLPPIGEVPAKVLEEQRKIIGEEFMGVVK